MCASRSLACSRTGWGCRQPLRGLGWPGILQCSSVTALAFCASREFRTPVWISRGSEVQRLFQLPFSAAASISTTLGNSLRLLMVVLNWFCFLFCCYGFCCFFVGFGFIFFHLSPLVFEVQLICALCSLFTFVVHCQQHLCSQTFIHRLLISF